MLWVCDSPVMASNSECTDCSRSSVKVSSGEYLGKSIGVIDKNHVGADANDGPVFREEVIGCEGQLAIPSLPTHPNRTGSWEPRSRNGFERMESREVNHLAELDEEPSRDQDDGWLHKGESRRIEIDVVHDFFHTAKQWKR